MNKVTVYTRNNCTACTATKRQLDRRGVDYETINVEENILIAEQLVAEGWRSMPVVKISGDDNISWSGHSESQINEHFGTLLIN